MIDAGTAHVEVGGIGVVVEFNVTYLSPSTVGRWMHIVEEYGFEGLRRKKVLPMNVRKANRHTDADFARLEKELEEAKIEVALLNYPRR